VRKLALAAAIGLIISDLALAQTVAPTAAPKTSNYTIKIIDTSNEPGATGFQTVTGLNDAGAVIGSYNYFLGFIPGGERGFIYNTAHGRLTLIPIPVSGGTASLIPDAINNQGAITGVYGFQGLHFGVMGPLFVYHNGAFTTFEVPSLFVGPTIKDINDQGVVVGSTVRPNATNTGFEGDGFLYANGVVSYFSVPNALSTSPVAINDQGVIAGSYSALDVNGVAHTHGFVDNNGRFTTIDGPGASNTFIAALNDHGVVVGTYTTPAGVSHGFIQRGDGKPTTIDVPDASSTNPVAVNNLGVVVGNYSGVNQNHGFVYDRHSTFTTIEIAGATDISIVGLNNNSEITGNVGIFDSTTGSILNRSFVAVPVSAGNITTTGH
jgi:hypothetical protein